MRKLNEIITHCSATPEGRHVTVATIRKWHKQRGWSDIGYHYVIYLDGSIHKGRPLNKVGAHVAGRNTGTIGICYVGGVKKDGKTPKDTRTAAQKRALEKLIGDLCTEHPTITKVSGHNDYAAKACPSFKVGSQYDHLIVGKGPVSKPKKPKTSTVLKLGARGKYVEALQEKLNKLSYGLDVDGIYGQATKKAVIDFQEKNGLKADGWAGTLTMSAIGQALMAQQVAPKLSKAEKMAKRLKPKSPLTAQSLLAAGATVTTGATAVNEFTGVVSETAENVAGPFPDWALGAVLILITAAVLYWLIWQRGAEKEGEEYYADV